MFQRTIADIAELLRGSKGHLRRCSVLIGAGCSRSAGIPLASEIVNEIERIYPAAYARAHKKDYPNCMAALDSGVRRDLIGRYVDRAKVNWAHLALAQLIEAGYIDRILTTNFDPLISRAAALINLFPAVYDFAASQMFKPDQVSRQAIFHLHGQRDGFVLLNTPTEVQKHRGHVKSVFADAHSGRIWLVVGYSGDNDPVFELLANTSTFEYGLYWVGYNATPAKHVSEKLLTAGKGAYYLGDWDADDFFVSLAQQLHCFPPRFVHKPFTCLRTTLENLSQYKAPHEEGRFDVTATVRNELDALIQTNEPSLSAQYYFLTAEYDRVVALLQKYRPKTLSNRDRNMLAWAHIVKGNKLHDEAKERQSEALYREAMDNFKQASRADETISEALYNWGNVLFDLSLLKRFDAPEVMTRSGEQLLRRAIEKYKAALSLNSHFWEAHNNLANALTDLGRDRSPTDRLALLREALPHYSRAAANSENRHVAYCNWGKALHDLARITDSKSTFIKSFEKFEMSSELNPQHYSTFLSWANALSDLARRSKSVKMFEEAFDRYRRAAEIDRKDTAAYFNLLNVIGDFTELVSGSKKRVILLEAAAIRRKLDRRKKGYLEPVPM
jgi:tetratricopeptide (TPR) repeat protein